MTALENIKIITTVSKWLGNGSINIFGLPFSGKDTHGHELAKFFNAPLIGGGDILRSEASPQHIKSHIATGSLAPSEEYLAIVMPYLSRDEFSNHALILNSVGRWFGEEKSVMDAALKSGHELKAVIYLDITKEESYRRWELAERNREDDIAKHILDKRFGEFNEKTLPVLDFYKKKGLLLHIDGMPPKNTVTNDILHKLYSLAS